MKKILSLMLCLILILAVLPTTAVSAYNTPTIVVSSAEGYAGDTVTIDVSLENNPGIVSMKLNIAYDADVLELTAKTPGAFNPTNMSFSQTMTANPYIVNWIDVLNPDNTANDTFITLTFKIKKGATIGKSQIQVYYDQADIFQLDWDEVAFEVENGSVDVLCKHDERIVIKAAIAPTCTEAGSTEEVSCKVCGVILQEPVVIDAYGHDTEIVGEKCHTNDEDGYTGDEMCKTCGEVVKSGKVIPAGHVWEAVDEVPATCKEKGIRAYFDCLLCDFISSDEIGTEITAEDLIIPTTAHKFTPVFESTVTCVQAGTVEFKTCIRCAQNFAADASEYSTTPLSTIESDKIPHSYNASDICTVCGYNRFLEYLSYDIVYGTAIITRCDTSFTGHMIIPDTIDGYPVKIIGARAFYGCETMTGVTIPDSVVLIEGYAFSECTSLTTVIIPHGVVNIGNGTFTNCYSLSYITIPNSVKNIETDAFYNCNNIEKILFDGTQQEWNAIIKATGNYPLYLAPIEFTFVYSSGDIGGDGEINNRDLALLMQALNGWDVEIIEETADVNNDGQINNRDIALLMRYLNGWDVELK